MMRSRLVPSAAASRRGARSSVSWGVRTSQRNTTCRTSSLRLRRSASLVVSSWSLSTSPCTYLERALYASCTLFSTRSRSDGVRNRAAARERIPLADALLLVVGTGHEGFERDDVVQVKLVGLLLPHPVVRVGTLVCLQQVARGSFQTPGTLLGQASAAGGTVHDSVDLCRHGGAESLQLREFRRVTRNLP